MNILFTSIWKSFSSVYFLFHSSHMLVPSRRIHWSWSHVTDYTSLSRSLWMLPLLEPLFCGFRACLHHNLCHCLSFYHFNFFSLILICFKILFSILFLLLLQTQCNNISLRWNNTSGSFDCICIACLQNTQCTHIMLHIYTQCPHMGVS